MSDDVIERRAAALESADVTLDEPTEERIANHLRAALAHPGTWARPPAIVASEWPPRPVPEPPPAPPSPSATAVSDLATRRRRRGLAWAGGAATGVAAALVLVLTLVGPAGETLDLDLTGTAAAPDARASIEATKSGPGWEVDIDVRDLPGAPEGTYYEGWAVRDDTHVPLGTFHLREPGEVKMWAGIALDEFGRVEITRQRVGGGQEPGEVVLVGPIDN